MSDSDNSGDHVDNVDIKRDEVVRRMLNTPPKQHPKPKEGRRPGRPKGS